MFQGRLDMQIEIPQIENLSARARLTLTKIRERCTKDFPARIFGSAAVALKCPNYIFLWTKLGREIIRDIDVVVLTSYKRDCLEAAVTNFGYNPESDNQQALLQYNRMYFRHNDYPTFLEVHISPLKFYHTISFTKEDFQEDETISVTDLVITKLQWSELKENKILLRDKYVSLEKERTSPDRKRDLRLIESELRRLSANTSQMIDLCLLFAEYDIIEKGYQGISFERISFFLETNWSLLETMRRNLKALRAFVTKALNKAELKEIGQEIISKVEYLEGKISNISGKNVKWQRQRFLHYLIPECCYPLGNPIEEPSEDIWNGVKLNKQLIHELR